MPGSHGTLLISCFVYFHISVQNFTISCLFRKFFVATLTYFLSFKNKAINMYKLINKRIFLIFIAEMCYNGSKAFGPCITIS